MKQLNRSRAIRRRSHERRRNRAPAPEVAAELAIIVDARRAAHPG